MADLQVDANKILRTVADLPCPKGLPLLGNLFQMAPAKIHLVLEQWARQFGSPFRVQLGTTPLTVWTQAELFQTVMRERPHLYRRFTPIESVMAELGGNGLFSAEGSAWEPQRRLVMRALSFSNIRAFYPTLSTITERFLARLQESAREHRTLEMTEELKRYTVDVTSTLAFGEDPHTLEQEQGVIQEQLALIPPALMRRITALFPYWHYVALPQDRSLARAMVAVHSYIQKMIGRARERMRQSPDAPPRNLLEAMLAAHDEPDSTVTDEQISANVLTLLVAGEDTTANAIAWGIMYIAADSHLQDRLFEQSRTAFGESKICPDYDALKHLDLCEAVCSEALRLRPVAPIFMFEPLTDVCLGGVAIPAGTQMFFLTRPSMLDPRHFGHPETFDPDRWKHPRDPSEGAHDQKAYLTFGAGPRVCPGRYLAAVEMRLVVSMLMRHFRIELAVDPAAIEEVSAFTMVPNQMPVRLKRRD
ncbi:cytochrome P450 [Paraburkholderia ginsengiterrae]|uniref:Cytochrome P450 n=1 Tax=Paraburkholderia ginsengiterrae TaxID=1462993 RepID=A0A1A9NFP9_9BURK|nr:cytochrome P450 [Paraburkholderia ginsengiterrae]OAJ62142.1 cytochrome P450 [Paraburkholderia ginsengiterrae]OAJ65496.1 cytochrome P450 [Paraburkholderia ginsengiterrae]